MSQSRLLLLGMLLVQNRHGYELLDAAEKELAVFSHLKKASVYYELNRMEAEGLVVSHKEEQAGRPPRRVFTVTPKGKETFFQLLHNALAQPEVGSVTADVGLMFLDWIPTTEAVSLLTRRVELLRASLAACQSIPEHRPESAVHLALSHLKAKLAFEIQWHESLVEALQGGPVHG